MASYTYKKIIKENIDLSPLGLYCSAKEYPYFCTPKGAKIFGRTGVDGIHYCFVRSFADMVFCVSPMCDTGRYVRPVARSFSDFIMLLIACQDVFNIEAAEIMDRDGFYKMLCTYEADVKQQSAIEVLKREFKLSAMEKPYEYIRELQSSFDYSKIRYTEDFYDPDMNLGAWQEKKWEVYFGNGFSSAKKRRKRPGREIPVKKSVVLDGRTWYIPAVYVCSEGLVADICTSADAEKMSEFMNKYQNIDGENLSRDEYELIERENPLNADIRVCVKVNGKTITSSSGCMTSWIPFSDMCRDSASEAVRHYMLDGKYAWSISRFKFKWATKRRPEIKKLEISISTSPKKYFGPIITVGEPNEKLDFINPIDNTSHTLVINDIEHMKISEDVFKNAEHFLPRCYMLIKYSVFPKIDGECFRLYDVAQSDCVVAKKPPDAFAPDAKNDFVIGIIGGADGPTAIFASDNGDKKELAEHCVCSSVHFEPQESARFRIIFIDKRTESAAVALLPDNIEKNEDKQ